MRGGYPSQTLPGAGGQPPTPPGSVSPLHHDQRPALDPLIHRAGIHKTSSQISPSRRRPGPTQRPITVPCTKPHVPGQICRRTLQAQTIAAAIQKAQGRPQRRPTRGGPLRLDSSHAPGRSYPSSRTTKTPPMPSFGRRRRTQNRTQSLSEPRTDPIRHEHTPAPPITASRTPSAARRRPERGAQLTDKPVVRRTNHRRVRRLGRLHGSFLARSAPRLPPGGPALHPRPRFARPRPQLGPPYHRVQSDSVRCDNHGVRLLSACSAEQCSKVPHPWSSEMKMEMRLGRVEAGQAPSLPG